MRSTAARLSAAFWRRTQVRQYTMRLLDALGHAPLMEAGTSLGMRTLSVGRDPIRVLLFGAGLAVGYGVRTRAEALDGPLADILSASGRGVVIENRAVQHLPVGDAFGSLGAAGTLTFHVAVWFPSFADATSLLGLRTWRAQLHRVVREVRAESSIPLVLTRMPVPTGRHLAVLIGRPWLTAVNRVITQVAGEYDGVAVADTPSFVIGDAGQVSQDSAYFVELAHELAPVVLHSLGTPTCPPVPVTGSTPR